MEKEHNEILEGSKGVNENETVEKPLVKVTARQINGAINAIQHVKLFHYKEVQTKYKTTIPSLKLLLTAAMKVKDNEVFVSEETRDFIVDLSKLHQELKTNERK